MGNTQNYPQSKKALPWVTIGPQSEKPTLSTWDKSDFTQIELDSSEWYQWLDNGQSFRLIFIQGGRSVGININYERRGDKLYWSGFKHISGRLIKKYIAVSSKLTREKLSEAGAHFWELQQEHNKLDPMAKYHQAIDDYEALLSRLLPHLPRNLARDARRELGRIQDNLGNK